jgi:hypothetical protein
METNPPNPLTGKSTTPTSTREATATTSLPGLPEISPIDWLEEARTIALDVWSGEETQHIDLDPIIAEAFAHRIAKLLDDSARYASNADFWRKKFEELRKKQPVNVEVASPATPQPRVVSERKPPVSSITPKSHTVIEASFKAETTPPTAKTPPFPLEKGIEPPPPRGIAEARRVATIQAQREQTAVPHAPPIVIEKGVPLQQPMRRYGITETLRMMEVGDSFLVPRKTSIGGCTRGVPEYKFATRKTPKGIRVWRLE